MESRPRAEVLVDFYQKLKGDRSNFESYWQSLHDYFYIEAEDVSVSYYPGSELNQRVVIQFQEVIYGRFL